MANELDLSRLDKRLVERLSKKGQLSEKEWEKHLKTLPDLAEQAAAVETEFETGALEPGED